MTDFTEGITFYDPETLLDPRDPIGHARFVITGTLHVPPLNYSIGIFSVLPEVEEYSPGDMAIVQLPSGELRLHLLMEDSWRVMVESPTP